MRSRMNFYLLGFLLCLLPLGLGASLSPETGRMQGRLFDEAGLPMEGPVGLTLSVYESETGGSAVYQENHASVPLAEGSFSVTLGQGVPVTGTHDETLYTGGGQRWIEIAVEGETLTPRQRVHAVPYALVAAVAESIRNTLALTGKVKQEYNETYDVWIQGNLGSTQDDSRNIAFLGNRIQDKLYVNPFGEYTSGTGIGGNLDVVGSLEVGSGAEIDGNHLYLRNSNSPAGSRTWGFVISEETGQFNLGPSYDNFPAGGSLARNPLVIYSQASSRSLMIDSAGVRVGVPLHAEDDAYKPGGGSWSVASDGRLKEQVRPLDGSLETLLALQGVTFRYKDPDAIGELQGERVGFVAQDVEEVFPDWISEGHDGYKRMTVRGFEALAVEALRELRTEAVGALRELRTEKDAEIALLRKELALLHKRMSQFESQTSSGVPR